MRPRSRIPQQDLAVGSRDRIPRQDPAVGSAQERCGSQRERCGSRPGSVWTPRGIYQLGCQSFREVAALGEDESDTVGLPIAERGGGRRWLVACGEVERVLGEGAFRVIPIYQ